MWRLSKSWIDYELSENANITEIEDRKIRFKVYPVDVLFILIFVLILHV